MRAKRPRSRASARSASRRAVGIGPGTRVSVRTEGTRIIVQSIDALLDELEAEAAALVAGTSYTVDQFIAERRAEALRDEQGG